MTGFLHIYWVVSSKQHKLVLKKTSKKETILSGVGTGTSAFFIYINDNYI